MRDPFSNEVFIFMGRNKKQIKILRWDEDKFILYTVKLYNKKRFTPYYNPRRINNFCPSMISIFFLPLNYS